MNISLPLFIPTFSFIYREAGVRYFPRQLAMRSVRENVCIYYSELDYYVFANSNCLYFYLVFIVIFSDYESILYNFKFLFIVNQTDMNIIFKRFFIAVSYTLVY